MAEATSGPTLGELAVRFGCTLKGDPDLRVSRVATLDDADAQSVTFVADTKHRRFLASTKAGAVVLEPKLADACPVSALLTTNPRATFARIAAVLHPAPAVIPGRHPTAAIDASANIDASASIGAHAVIGANVSIGERCVIGPGSVVMDGAQIGADTRLVARVTLCSGVIIGERCLFHPGAVIGADGFGLAPDGGGRWIKVPQVGTVRIGNDVEVGANTTIDRGAIGDTVIGDGVKFDNQIQIGHNVRIGANTVMAAFAGVSGSTTIGERCMLAGQVGVAGHITICDDVVVTGKSFVSSSIHKPGYYSSGLTVDDARRFRKNAARFHQLDDIVRQLRGRSDRPPDDQQDDQPTDNRNEDE